MNLKKKILYTGFPIKVAKSQACPSDHMNDVALFVGNFQTTPRVENIKFD